MVIYIWKMNLTYFINKLLTVPRGTLKFKKLWQQQIGQLSEETKEPVQS